MRAVDAVAAGRVHVQLAVDRHRVAGMGRHSLGQVDVVVDLQAVAQGGGHRQVLVGAHVLRLGRHVPGERDLGPGPAVRDVAVQRGVVGRVAAAAGGGRDQEDGG